MELEGGMRTALRQLTSHSLTVICTFLAICRSWALYKTVVSASAAPLALGTTGEPDRTSSVFRCAIWNDSSELDAETEPELPLVPLVPETSVCAVLSVPVSLRCLPSTLRKPALSALPAVLPELE